MCYTSIEYFYKKQGIGSPNKFFTSQTCFDLKGIYDG